MHQARKRCCSTNALATRGRHALWMVVRCCTRIAGHGGLRPMADSLLGTVRIGDRHRLRLNLVVLILRGRCHTGGSVEAIRRPVPISQELHILIREYGGGYGAQGTRIATVGALVPSWRMHLQNGRACITRGLGLCGKMSACSSRIAGRFGLMQGWLTQVPGAKSLIDTGA